jgi:hypothetical protein
MNNIVQDVLDRLIGKPEIILQSVLRPEFDDKRDLIITNAQALFYDHKRHTIIIEENAPLLLWVKCLDCGIYWTQCDLCSGGYNTKGVGKLNFTCKHRRSDGKCHG